MKSKVKINALEQADFIYKLLVLARKYKSIKNNGGYQLASALIYANLAEYYSYELISYIRLNINNKHTGDLYHLDTEHTVGLEERTLGNMIRLLGAYQFPNKQKTISVISNIKGNRDDLFHNLTETPSKKTTIFGLAKNIQEQTEELLVIWENIFNDFIKSALKR